MQWIFNPPNASHMDGAGKRLIWSVRQILTSLTTEKTLNNDQLHTFLLEAKSILNFQPSTSIITNAYDLEPLTPNHLLNWCPTSNLLPSLPSNKNCFARIVGNMYYI